MRAPDVKPLEWAAILAGGKGRRMGADKIALPLGGQPLIERVWRTLHPLAERVVVVGGPARLEPWGVPTVGDRYPGADSLGGLTTALCHARDVAGMDAWVLCVAGDMPFLQPGLLRRLAGLRGNFDAVVPRTTLGFEPLCACYRATCVRVFEEQIEGGNLRIYDAFRRLNVLEVGEAVLREEDERLLSFLNVNRPADLEAATRLLEEGVPSP